MLGMLMNMEGAPTRTEVEDILVRWIVLNADEFKSGEDVLDEEDELPYDGPAKAGNFLAEAYISAFWTAAHDGPLLDGPELYKTILAAWVRSFKPRIAAELTKRGVDAKERLKGETFEEEAGLGWFESCSLEKMTLPRRQARMVGRACGDLAASRKLAMWRFMESAEAERMGLTR